MEFLLAGFLAPYLTIGVLNPDGAVAVLVDAVDIAQFAKHLPSSVAIVVLIHAINLTTIDIWLIFQECHRILGGKLGDGIVG